MTYIGDAHDIRARYAFLDETSLKAPRIRLWLKRGPRPSHAGGLLKDMPAKGYRKGKTDDRLPLSRQIYVRYPDDEYLQLKTDAADRAMTVSKLVRALTSAHYKRQRPELKQARGHIAGLIRELNRIGNNLNQLARMANTGMVTVQEAELRLHLARLHDAIARL
jgi:mobilization protein NikA